MRDRKSGNHVIDMIFPIALFFVFAILAVMVLLLSANIYSTNNHNQRISESIYTPVSYVAEKVRQNDVENGIYVDKIDGIDAIVLSNTYDEVKYLTFVYCMDGYMRELFVPAEHKPDLISGREIMKADNMKISVDSNNVARIVIRDADGNEGSASLYLKSSGN